MNHNWDFSSIYQYRHVLWNGLLGTLQLAVIAVLCAMLVGLLISFARISRPLAIRVPAMMFINFFRNIPFIVQLFWFYYAIPVLTGLQANPFMASLYALTLYGGAYFAEIYRAGIQSVETGQWEGARAIGLSQAGAMRYVVLPQAVRRVIPPLTTQVIELIKLTTVASTVSYFEILNAAKLVADQDFRPIESYTTVAFILITLLLIIAFASARLERRLRMATR